MEILECLPLLIAIIATYIAWQQWRANIYKLRIDLFEKRYAIFNATRKFLTIIIRNAKFEMRDFYQFRADTSDSYFLFEKNIVEYLEEIDRKALELCATQKQYKDIPKSSERSKLVNKESEILKWLIDQLPELKKMFMSYLNFKKI